MSKDKEAKSRPFLVDVNQETWRILQIVVSDQTLDVVIVVHCLSTVRNTMTPVRLTYQNTAAGRWN